MKVIQILAAAASVHAISQADFLSQAVAALNNLPGCVVNCVLEIEPSTNPLVLTEHLCQFPSAYADLVNKCVAGACLDADKERGSTFASTIPATCAVFKETFGAQAQSPSPAAAASPSPAQASPSPAQASPAPSPAGQSNQQTQAATSAQPAAAAATTTAAAVAGAASGTSAVASAAAATAAAGTSVQTTAAAGSGSTAGSSNGVATPNNGCTTSSGAAISIIAPQSNSALTVGQPLRITWTVVGTPDPAFNAAAISFEINNAANPNNVVAVPGGALTFAQVPRVSDFSASSTVPNIANGNLYTVKSIYKDGAINRYCFSPTFKVSGGTGAVGAAPGAAAGAAVTTRAAAAGGSTATTAASSSGSLALVSAAAGLAALFAL